MVERETPVRTGKTGPSLPFAQQKETGEASTSSSHLQARRRHAGGTDAIHRITAELTAAHAVRPGRRRLTRLFIATRALLL